MSLKMTQNYINQDRKLLIYITKYESRQMDNRLKKNSVWYQQGRVSVRAIRIKYVGMNVPGKGICPLSAVISTGRCNTFVKSISWCSKTQGLSWSFIQLSGYCIQLPLWMDRQISLLREVLSQQAIGIFIWSSLPGALWITEVHLDVRWQSRAFMSL